MSFFLIGAGRPCTSHGALNRAPCHEMRRASPEPELATPCPAAYPVARALEIFRDRPLGMQHLSSGGMIFAEAAEAPQMAFGITAALILPELGALGPSPATSFSGQDSPMGRQSAGTHVDS